MEGSKKQNQFEKIRAVVFDFDGTLAVLNIDFSSMKERVFDLIKHHGIGDELIEERYLLEIIDEVYQILWRRNQTMAQEFYHEAHLVLHEVELKADYLFFLIG